MPPPKLPLLSAPTVSVLVFQQRLKAGAEVERNKSSRSISEREKVKAESKLHPPDWREESGNVNFTGLPVAPGC